ncbi:MAG: xanthine dehydrogenase family protein subunit M [Desulfobacterales bacterium]|nr:xanthine dehydrogenase family protein subunit M [Desulfobacterales bacterium]
MNNMEFLKPASLEDLFQMTKAHKDEVTFIAGGTNLIPQMERGVESPSLIIDVSDLQEMSTITENGNIISIGGSVTIADIAADSIIKTCAPVLADAALQLGNPLTRNRATIGGNLADASPCADTAPPLMTLEATVHIADVDGNIKDVPISKFYLDYRFTALGRGDVITKISFQKQGKSQKGNFSKIGLRKGSAISVINMAILLDFDHDTCKQARIAMGSIAATPIRIYKVEELLEGKKINDALIEECGELVKTEISPITDIRGSAEYRTAVAATLLKRNIKKAIL